MYFQRDTSQGLAAGRVSLVNARDLSEILMLLLLLLFILFNIYAEQNATFENVAVETIEDNTIGDSSGRKDIKVLEILMLLLMFCHHNQDDYDHDDH